MRSRTSGACTVQRCCSCAGRKGGERPVGHVETEPLAWGHTPDEATQRIEALSLYDVKTALDEAIARAPAEW